MLKKDGIVVEVRMKKTVQQIMSVLPEGQIDGNIQEEITGVTSDSRVVEDGFLFVCLPGLHVDGHDFVEKAIAQGARTILASRRIEHPDNITVIYVPDTREALLKVAPCFYEYPAQKMRMIGVTGTNGKTTTTHIIGHILEEQGYKVGIIGTVHVLIGKKAYPIHNTTPDAGELQPILQRMVDEKVDYCIMEVSSHALDLRRVAGVEFDTAVFTNLTQDHLDYHKTFENYLAAKAKLFEQVSAAGQKKENKGAVINIDDPYGRDILAKTSAPTITYGTKGQGDLEAVDIHMTSKHTACEISFEGKQYHMEANITGMFNIYNVLAAVGATLQEGVPMDKIIKALASFHAVPGRFELVEEGQNFAVVVDYAHTPDGLENILTTAKEITSKRIIVVFGCGGDRDATKRPIMGRIAAKYADVIYVTSDNPRTEDPQSIVDQVTAGVMEDLSEGKICHSITDREEAIRAAIAFAKEGDIVLIAGKGHEDYQILKDKTIHFDDREVARQALRGE